MNPERQDVDRSTRRVIGWIDDVLEVHTRKHVLDHSSVVIELTNALR
jgi:hypothetical protein